MNIKENWFKIVAVIILLLITTFNIYEREQINKLSEELEEDIILNEEECWLMNLDDNGNGFNFPIKGYCVQLKTACTASWHNIPCQWIDGEINESRCQCGWFQEG